MSVMTAIAAVAVFAASVSGAPEVPGDVAGEAPGGVSVVEPSAAPTDEPTMEATQAPMVGPSAVPDDIEAAGPDEEAPAASVDDGTQAPHERGVAGLPVCGPFTPVGSGCYSELTGGGVWEWEDGSTTYTWDDGRMITIFPDGREERTGDWSGHRMPWDEESSESGEVEAAAATQSDTPVDGKKSVTGTRTELAATGGEHVLIGIAVAVALVVLGLLAMWAGGSRRQWIAVEEPGVGDRTFRFSDWRDFSEWVRSTQVEPVLEDTGDHQYATRIERACHKMVTTQGEHGWEEMAHLAGVRVYEIN